jgi:ketosteroid isomerase-like protein
VWLLEKNGALIEVENIWCLESTKTRSLVVPLVGLAISFASPTFAQQTSPPDAKLRQEFEAFVKKFDDVWNSSDQAAWSALFTDDAIEVTHTGPIYGRDALQKLWADLKLNFSNHITTLDQYSPHMIGTAGNEVWMNAKYSLTVKGQNFGPVEQSGNLCAILVREGDAWKMRMFTWNVTPAPAPTASPSTQ